MNKRYHVLTVILAVLLVLTVAVTGCSSTPAATAPANKANPADSFPEKDIVAVYHSGVGSGGDLMLRSMGKAIQSYLNGHNIVVEHRIGGSGSVAMGYTYTQPKDGYTIMGVSTSEVMASVLLGSEIKYNQFDYLCGLATDPEYLYCHKNAPFNSLEELIAYAKANPGKLNFGFPVAAGSEAMALTMLTEASGIEVQNVVFDSGSECFTSLLGGHVDVSVGGYGDFGAQYEAGNIKVFATTNLERTAFLPKIPSMKELGYDIALEKARGIVCPQGVPAEIQDKLRELCKKALDDPEFVSSLEIEGCTVEYMTGEEVKASYDNFAKLVEEKLK